MKPEFVSKRQKPTDEDITTRIEYAKSVGMKCELCGAIDMTGDIVSFKL